MHICFYVMQEHLIKNSFHQRLLNKVQATGMLNVLTQQ